MREACIASYTQTEWIPFLSEVKLEHSQYFPIYWEHVYMCVFISIAFYTPLHSNQYTLQVLLCILAQALLLG